MKYRNNGHRGLRHSTDRFDTAKQLKAVGSSNFNHSTSAAVRIIRDYRPVMRKKTVGKGSATVDQICQIYLGFRITEELMYYSGINYNWKLILECCVGLWLRTEWKVIFMQSVCLGVFPYYTDLGEENAKKNKNYLAVISYVTSGCTQLRSECLAVRTHGYRPFTV
jgi:hypothetical protein